MRESRRSLCSNCVALHHRRRQWRQSRWRGQDRSFHRRRKNVRSDVVRKIGVIARGKLAALVKISFSQALKSFALNVDVMNNPGALPYLSPGKM